MRTPNVSGKYEVADSDLRLTGDTEQGAEILFMLNHGGRSKPGESKVLSLGIEPPDTLAWKRVGADGQTRFIRFSLKK